MLRYFLTHHPYNYSFRAPDDYVALVTCTMLGNGVGLAHGDWVVEPGDHLVQAKVHLGEEYGSIRQRVTTVRQDDLKNALLSVMIDGESWDKDFGRYAESGQRAETWAAVAERRHHQYPHLEPDLRRIGMELASQLGQPTPNSF